MTQRSSGLDRSLRQLRFAKALTGTNLKASLALRGSFALQSVFMLVNNLAFFSIWLIFFNRFSSVRGWQLEDMTILFGVVAGGFGLSQVFAGGAQQIARMIAGGDLDPLLAQPKSPLLQSIGSHSVASGWGDLSTGIGFLAIALVDRPAVVLLAIVAVLCSMTVFIATAVVFQSLAFWLGRIETLARQMWDFQVTFSLYPSSLFGGLLRLLLFTAIPAGFVGYLPAEVVRTPSVGLTAGMVGGAVAYAALALVTFHRGLRWYESGNRFGGIW